MRIWTITLASETEYTIGNVTAAQVTAVAEVLGGATWDTIEPLAGPRQLIAWVAVLEANEADGDITASLADVMSRPMAAVLSLMTVTDQE